MPLNPADAHIVAAVQAHFKTDPPARLGIAVSGGGDSMALMHILAGLFATEATVLHVATVDHGLRAGSTAEAAFVADVAETLGLAHSTLRWRHHPERGNLQGNARQARYGLLTEWARGHDIPMLALGHTADDQAETVLMRLARAAGSSGLAAMPSTRRVDGVTLIRPLLEVARADLRGYLRRIGQRWLDDPSNYNLRFDRIKARKALETLAPLGITADALTDVADNMARVDRALDWYCFLTARDLVQIHDGDVVIDLPGLRTQPEETARRLLLHAIRWITTSVYAPRRRPMLGFLEAALKGQSATLGGCRLQCKGGKLWISREYSAVRGRVCATDALWDGCWRLDAPGATDADCQIGPLGRRGLRALPGWRDAGRPYAAAMATPAVWQGDALVAAPLVGWPQGWTARRMTGSEDFFATLLSH